jgi:hypothetical protein
MLIHGRSSQITQAPLPDNQLLAVLKVNIPLYAAPNRRALLLLRQAIPEYFTSLIFPGV